MVSSVGKHVKAVREAKSPKLSAQGLADRVSALGYPYSRSQLVNLEYGRKKTLEVSELVAIAEALDIAPIELLYPGLPDGDVEYLPGQTTRAFDALKNFTGEDRTARGERNRYLAMIRMFEMERPELEAVETDSPEGRAARNLIESTRGVLIDAGYTVAGPPPRLHVEVFRGSRLEQFVEEGEDDE